MRCEFLIPGRLSTTAAPFMDALTRAGRAAGDVINVTDHYRGKEDLLVLYGVGSPERDIARKAHVKSGRHVLLWDLGYFGRHGDRSGWLRCSIDHDHPQAYLDATPVESSRWDSLGIELRDDYAAGGPIILVGLGRKSRKYLNESDWERNTWGKLAAKYPNRRVIYRPKPNHPSPALHLDTDERTPIPELLKGASLVVCRHSNVAIDAIIAGVPFDCEDGAAYWLLAKPFTKANRLDFLRRLAHWQYTAREANVAWGFAKSMLQPMKVAA